VPNKESAAASAHNALHASSHRVRAGIRIMGFPRG